MNIKIVNSKGDRVCVREGRNTETCKHNFDVSHCINCSVYAGIPSYKNGKKILFEA